MLGHTTFSDLNTHLSNASFEKKAEPPLWYDHLSLIFRLLHQFFPGRYFKLPDDDGRRLQDTTITSKTIQKRPLSTLDPRRLLPNLSSSFIGTFCCQHMDAFALEVLEDAKSWNWPIVKRIEQSGNQGKPLLPNLLSCLIKESQALGGTVLEQFWETIGKCDNKLKDNIKTVTSVPPGQASTILFAGVNREDIRLGPLFDMAAEYFAHLAVAFVNPGGPESADSTPSSTDELLELANKEGFGKRNQEALKRLAFKRDGARCVMTGVTFDELPTEDDNFSPVLTHLIPNSIHGKPDTLKCLATFAGEEARDLVLKQMNDIGNVANVQSDAYVKYDGLRWGIEAQEGETVKYVYRRVPYNPNVGPASINLRDGKEIHFGRGIKGERLGGGPLPLFCNVQLAVARVLRMSGAAEVVMQLRADSDDSDTPHAYVASDYFLDILDAKLHLQSIIVISGAIDLIQPNVHQSALTRDGSTFQDMFLLGVDSHREFKDSGNLKAVPDGEGVCDKHPIHLQGDTVDEFRALLWSFYALPSDIFDATRPENIDTIKFMNLARVTHKYNFISTEKWALEILTLYLTSVSQQPIPSELDGPSFEPLSPEILENLTKVAVLCTSEDQPLFKKTMAGWELLLGHGDYAETAIRVAELLGLRHLRASAYYAIMIKGRQAWDLKPNLSREQRITLLSGHHALFELSRGLLGSPPQFHNCYGAQTCRRSLASCWGNLFAGGISDSDTIPAANSLHPLDLLGRLQLLEGQFVKISEYAATALNGMTRPCALEGLKAIRALQEKLRLDLSDCFQDVA
ncbi:uncharacterized protein LACBIDRAFT_295301 [Laccaria bicolor S238N-H82]|uniref:Predicted protein n=1 Tax=Laccaria bicolor (strain S238N-H82 / ATCC MYA-4686) TaxID=486041 RepID=B0DQ84_LACBS|nr:uncharacterized protein LACBIDRAFT_295301 [Laccaria bicolor S238N-H82]EDR03339.1 predicted protein [Laccaria bicolor S238N-H82]|eukprot:XP_001886135.1 predicted protein [Laccaria bicolor S238N-H82]